MGPSKSEKGGPSAVLPGQRLKAKLFGLGSLARVVSAILAILLSYNFCFLFWEGKEEI